MAAMTKEHDEQLAFNEFRQNTRQTEENEDKEERKCRLKMKRKREEFYSPWLLYITTQFLFLSSPPAVISASCENKSRNGMRREERDLVQNNCENEMENQTNGKENAVCTRTAVCCASGRQNECTSSTNSSTNY